MAEAKLDILLKADVGQATKAIKQFVDTAEKEAAEASNSFENLDEEIKQVGNTLKKGVDPKAFADLVKQVKQLQAALAAIKPNQLSTTNTAIKQVASSTNVANNAVLNFGRIAQDASFGIIGVANNIEPFFQSIARLRQETASGGSALKSFFGAITGPGGIGLLIGAISLFDAYSNGYGIFAGRAKKAASAQKEFNEELDKARSGAEAVGANLRALISIAGDSAKSDTIRNNALKEINKTTEQYGINITKASIASGAAAAEIDKLTNSLVAQAVAAKAADKVADLIIAQANAQRDLAKATELEAKARQQAQGLNRTARQQELGVNEIVVTQAQVAVKNLAAAQKALADVDTELSQTKTFLNQQLEAGLIVTKKDTQAKKENKKVQEEINALFVGFSQITLNNLGLTPAVTSAEALSAAILKSKNDATDLANKAKEIAANLVTAAANGRVFAPDNLAQGVTQPQAITNVQAENLRATAEAQQQLADATQNTNAAFSLLSPAIDQAFNAMANGENAIEAVGQAIKQLIVQLIKAVVQAVILSAILNAISPGSTTVGSTLKGLLGFRAAGGPVSGGSPYVVGESGPELFIPGTSGQVVPNMALQGSGGGNVSFEIRGDVLFGLLKRTQGNRSGNF